MSKTAVPRTPDSICYVLQSANAATIISDLRDEDGANYHKDLGWEPLQALRITGESRDNRLGLNDPRGVCRRISHEVEGWQQPSVLFGWVFLVSCVSIGYVIVRQSCMV
jgi:hypothetical protein